MLDYEVLNVNSFPVNWYEEKKDKKDAKKNGKDDTLYQSYVTLLRKEDFVMPVEVEIIFDNGEKVREHWDGQSRWTRFAIRRRRKSCLRNSIPTIPCRSTATISTTAS